MFALRLGFIAMMRLLICLHSSKVNDFCVINLYFLVVKDRLFLQKPAAFHSEKRCKDKQKKSRLQVFSEVKKQGYKEGYKKV
ncbi:hypothetical protein DWZ10_09430 [Segatella copri]|nr:hypothetical protein DWZ10_09430 [Segatella copri]